jgi:hypothetical protein
MDAIDRKLEVRALELTMQDLPFLGKLLRIGEVLQLATAAASLEVRTGRIDASGRWIEDRRCLGAPKIFPAMRDVGLDGFARDRPLDEDDPAVDPRQGRPTMGELANRQLH